MKRNIRRAALAMAVTGFLTAIPAGFGQAPAVPAAEAKPAAATTAAPKAPAGGWAFEVATIKPANMPTPADFMNGKAHIGRKVDAARVDIGFMSLTDLIASAYDVKQYQVSGPDWMSGMVAQHFDVLAKMPEGATKEQVPAMLQALLAERFKLAIHRDKKDQPIYALVVAKGGPKMKESAADAPPPAAPEKAEAAPGDPGPEPTPAKDANPQFKVNRNADGSGIATMHTPEGNVKVSFGPAGMRTEMEKMSMERLAEQLTMMMDRPVVNLTDLKGNYQVVLDISMADMMSIRRKFGAPVAAGGVASGDAGSLPSDAASDPSGSVFKSVQQLGLKLEPRKAPLDQIVVDHAEKTPTQN